MSAGEIKNMALDEGFIIYNSYETVTSRYLLSLIFPTGRLIFTLNGILQNYYSLFLDTAGNETNYNKLIFNGLTINSKLKWNF